MYLKRYILKMKYELQSTQTFKRWLAGGGKSSQERDIEKAKALLNTPEK
jgi:putative component of toxin-antitoxin plasmid stabilization module